MSATPLAGNSFSWVLQSSWQAAVLVLLVLVVQMIFRSKLSHAWRYGLWLLVVVRLLMPTSPQSAISIFNLTKFTSRQAIGAHFVPSGADAPEVPISDLQVFAPDTHTFHASAARTEVQKAGAASSTDVRPKRLTNWFGIACAIWLLGICLLALRLVWANLRFGFRLARHVPVTDATIIQLVKNCAILLRISHPIVVMETEEVDSPAVCGLWKKRLLMPDGTFERFSSEELRHIFLHEMAHIKRRDIEVNWLTVVLQILHWFNPVLWLAFARMRADRELATDALALAHVAGTENVPYGETILKVVENLARRSNQPGLVGVAESKAGLKERLLAIARCRASRPRRWAAVGIVALVAGIGLTAAQERQPPVAAEQATQAVHQRKFAIRVSDYDNGTPLTGVNVSYTLDYFGGKSIQKRSLTDKDGRAAIQYDLSDLHHFAYVAQKTNYLTLKGEWFDQELQQLGDEFETRLSQGIEIGGTVVDENGQPVSGAEVSIDQPMDILLTDGHRYVTHAEMWHAPSGQRLAVTRADGTWKAKCIWEGLGWASLRIHHPDFADITCSTELTSATQGDGKGVKVRFDDLKNHTVRLTLAKGVPLRGSVVDEAGAPLAGIVVNYAELLTAPNARDQLLGQRTIMTDSAGKFQLDHVPRKSLFFLVQTAGYAPAVAELYPKAPDSEIGLRLAKGIKLVGQINDKQGDPVAGTHVTFSDFSIWRGVHWETTTDSNGRFEWNDAPREKFELQFEKNGFISKTKIVDVSSSTDLVLRLDRTLHLTGKVLDAETREPITNFRIEYPVDLNGVYQSSSMPGSNGFYSLDVGRLYSGMWKGGYANECVFRAEADGYAPATSRTFSSRKGDVGDVSYDVDLKPTHQLFGKVVGPDARPVVGAQVALSTPDAELYLSGKPKFESPPSSFGVTDVQGRFHLNYVPRASSLLVVDEIGFARIETNEFSSNVTVKLKPWGRIEGTVWRYDKVVTNESVSAMPFRDDGTPWTRSTRFSTKSDDHGRFSFAFVPPGQFAVFALGMRVTAPVKSGEPAVVQIGGSGRPVVGKFKVANPYVEIEWGRNLDIYTFGTVPPRARENFKTRDEFLAWTHRPDIEHAFNLIRDYPLHCEKDGSFRIDQVVPGQYQMMINLLDPREPNARAYSGLIAKYEGIFEVPTNSPNTREPLDLGVIPISLTPQVVKGETAAPEFEASDMDDRMFKLSDYRGKYVLLDFWATWCGPCIGEIPYLKQAHEKFKNRSNFIIISLSLDKSISEPREFLKKNDLPWVQGYLGDGSKTKVAEQYGVQGIPALFLVSPDGKIIESELEGSSLIARLENHLK